MDRDGKNKHDLTKDSKEFAYGFSASKDGRRIAYHKSYQVYVADADGSNARKIDDRPSRSTSHRSGRQTAGTCSSSPESITTATRTSCQRRRHRPPQARRPGRLPRRDRVPRCPRLPRRQQRHPGLVGGRHLGLLHRQGRHNVELFRVALDGQSERLTQTPDGSLHYHPTPSPDGRWLAYGSKRGGVRQLYVMRLADRSERRLTDLATGPRGHVAALATDAGPEPQVSRPA